MRIAVNASRAKSGGGIRHLKGILKNHPSFIGKDHEIHVWSYPKLLAEIKEESYIVKHKASFFNKKLPLQLIWEAFFLPQKIRKYNCDVLINVDAGSVCPFNPSITISRDMLPFEPKAIENFGIKFKLRQVVLRYVSCYSLNNASAAVFLTKYAAKTISKYLKKDLIYEIIPHGVDKSFILKNTIKYPEDKSSAVTITYVSPCLPYKNHKNVIKAIHRLRSLGYNLKLKMIGEITEFSRKEIANAVNKYDSNCKFITINENVSQKDIPNILYNTHIFLFASSCENMPNSLVEGMSAGLPIACSNIGSMPEILKDGGIYFDPKIADSIYNALKKLLDDTILRQECSKVAKKLALEYSWERCSREIFNLAIRVGKDNHLRH